MLVIWSETLRYVYIDKTCIHFDKQYSTAGCKQIKIPSSGLIRMSFSKLDCVKNRIDYEDINIVNALDRFTPNITGQDTQ